MLNEWTINQGPKRSPLGSPKGEGEREREGGGGGGWIILPYEN